MDLVAVSRKETMRTPVSLALLGEAPAVKQLEGPLIHNLDAVDVEALPDDLPGRFEVDLSGLESLHSTIHVRDLVAPERVIILTPPETVIVSVAAPRLLAAEDQPAEAQPAPAAETAAAT